MSQPILNSPCSNCPFRRSCLKGWLGRRRAQQIVDSMIDEDASFSCHKTTEVTTGRSGMERHCAGAASILWRMEMPNQIMRIMGRLGAWDPDAMNHDGVFDTFEEFVEHHATGAVR